MSKFSGIVYGTGSSLNLGLGFIPESVKLTAGNGTGVIEWNAANVKGSTEGYKLTLGASSTVVFAPLSSTGITVFKGGDAVASSTVANQVIAGQIPNHATTKGDFVPAPAGYQMPDGITIKDTSVCNAASSWFYIEAN